MDRTEYTFEDNVCVEHVITTTTLFTTSEDGARTDSGTLPEVTVSTALDSNEPCCAAG